MTIDFEVKTMHGDKILSDDCKTRDQLLQDCMAYKEYIKVLLRETIDNRHEVKTMRYVAVVSLLLGVAGSIIGLVGVLL